MERGTRAVEVVVGIALSGTVVLVALGIYVASGPTGDAHPWFLSAGLTFAGAVLLTVFYFGIHPLLIRLDTWRVRTVSSLLSERAGAVRHRDSARAAKPLQTGALSIISAVYGAGEAWVDVKDYVTAQIVGDRAVMDVTNSAFGGDPIYGLPKTLKVSYTAGTDRTKIVEVPEGGKLSLP